MAEPQYSYTCNHCRNTFWSYSTNPWKVCNTCASWGHRGDGTDGECPRCNQLAAANETREDEDNG